MKKFVSVILLSLLLASCQGDNSSQPESSIDSVESSIASTESSEETSEVSQEKESWTETLEKDGKKIVTEYSNYGKDWKETITENKDGALVYEKMTVFKDGKTTELLERFYDSDGKVLKSESFKDTYENGILVKKREIVVENGVTKLTETEYNADGKADKISIDTTNPDGSKTSEKQEFDYEKNTKDTSVVYYENGTMESTKSEHITTDLESNVVLNKWVSTNGTAYGGQCHIIDYHYYKDGKLLGRRVVYTSIGRQEEDLTAEKYYNADDVLIWEEITQTDSESKPISITQIVYKENGYFKAVSSSSKRFYYESLDGETETWFLDCDYNMETNTITAMVVNGDYCTVDEAQVKANEMTQLEVVFRELIDQFFKS